MTGYSYQIRFASAFEKLCWGIDSTVPPKSESTEISLSAVRNEVCGFQVLIDCDHDFVLTTDRSNWLHPMGFKPRLRLEVKIPELPSSAVECFTVGYIEGDDHRYWTETLERSGWNEAIANRTQPVYARLRIPKDANPGMIQGTVNAYAQRGFEPETRVWQGTINLHISPVALPDPVNFKFHLNLWQHCTSIARYHRVGLWSDSHFALIDRYYQSLAQLGQKAVSVIAAEIPWSGQFCFRDPGYPSYLFEHSVIEVTRSAQNQLVLNFTHLDRQLALAARHGLDREIDLFGLLNVWQDKAHGFGKVAPDAPDAIRVRCYDEASGMFSYLNTAAELQVYIRAIHDHLDEAGLIDRVRIAADEPSDLQAFSASLAFLKQAAPKFRYNAAINHFEFIEQAPADVSDFIPILSLVFRDTQRTSALIDQVHARGGLMMWYVCCWPPIPNTFLHSPLIESRLIGWLTHYLNLDGFLRWAFCLWPADPWRRVSWRAPIWYSGDMYFVLPGNDGTPVETLRYEALRTAAQDYELLHMAQEKLGKARAEPTIQQAFKLILHAASINDFANVGSARANDLYSTDADDYTSARQLIVTAIESAPGG